MLFCSFSVGTRLPHGQIVKIVAQRRKRYVCSSSLMSVCSASYEQHVVLSARALNALEEKTVVCVFTALSCQLLGHHENKING